MRLTHIRLFVFCLLIFIVAGLFYTQIIRGASYHTKSVNNRIRAVSVEGPRGRIFDRNGLVLADNHKAFHVGVIPQDMGDKDELFAYLGRLLQKDVKQLRRQYEAKRRTPFTPVILAQDVPKEIVVKVKEDQLLYPELVIEEGFERYYPFALSGAHVLGYVGKIDPDEIDDLQSFGYTLLSVIGKSGIEKKYDNVLRGFPGGRQIEINARGQEVRLLGLKEPVKGHDIVLTIDARLQNVAQDLLEDRRGAVVVMDLNNGEVLSMVSNPSFDPNAFSDRSRQGLLSGYFNNAASPLMDRAVLGQYPPGSVFKVPVALAALELGQIVPSTTFDCPGFYSLGQTKFGCSHVHDKEDLRQAIAHSCNVYFYRLGRMLGASTIGAWAKAFGLGRPTGIDLPYENKGKVVSAPRQGKSWYTGNTLNLSIGQGETLATPLQLTVLMAAVANDGVILKPRLAKALNNKLIPPLDFSKQPMVRLHDATWRVVQEGLREVIKDADGTANILNDLSNIKIYGKTGTAQSGGERAHHAWFAGYARSSKNNIAFCIFLEYGGSSANAVALTKQLLAQMQVLKII